MPFGDIAMYFELSAEVPVGNLANIIRLSKSYTKSKTCNKSFVQDLLCKVGSIVARHGFGGQRQVVPLLYGNLRSKKEPLRKEAKMLCYLPNTKQRIEFIE